VGKKPAWGGEAMPGKLIKITFYTLKNLTRKKTGFIY